jgi:hypothetical protein
MPVLPEEQPGNILHAGMVALLQNSLVLEHTTDNTNTHTQDNNLRTPQRSELEHVISYKN